ncbi:MAG: hypothetical protein QF415_07465 [Candidatus Undinarchaeales archaeon]|jgi:hypothetical protein|nr:hypothetical protein [Candidatus Undinarchaeales archaeon]MDP7492302.1 hypothetical protein [Candidatus Undinarchaeales archaeon]
MVLYTQGEQGGTYELHQPEYDGFRSVEEYTQMPGLPASDSFTVPGFVLNYYIIVYFLGMQLHKPTRMFSGTKLVFPFLFLESSVVLGLALLPLWLPLLVIFIALAML